MLLLEGGSGWAGPPGFNMKWDKHSKYGPQRGPGLWGSSQTQHVKKKKRKSINFTVLSKSLLLYYLLFLVGLSHFYFWFTHNLHHVRLTILKCIINRHLAHLRCCATTKLYYFHEHTYTHIYTHTSAVTTWAPDGPPWSLILWSFSALKGTRLLQESPNP